MTKTELLEQIVKKQDELIEWLDSDLESGDALIRLQLSILKKQLEECEEKEKILIDFANKLTKDFNEDKTDQSQIGFSTDLDINDLY